MTATDEPVVIHFELTPADVNQGFVDDPGRRNGRRWMLLLVLLPTAFFVINANDYVSGEAMMKSALMVAMPLAFMVVLFLFLQRASRAGARTLATFREEDRKQTYHFERDAFEIETGTTKSRVAYRGLHSFVEGKDALLLFTRPRIIHLVPKRAFGPGELDQVTGWLRATVSPPKPSVGPLRVLLLWAALIVAFLLIWLLLQPSPASGQ